jgi:hypothetical protein
MDITDCYINQLVKFVLTMVELLLIDRSMANFFASLIDAQRHLGVVITSNPNVYYCAFVYCCARFVMYVWSQSLAKCITIYWGMTIIELPNDIAMVANIV